MGNVSFADVVHSSIAFDPSDEAEALILKLIDTSWVQRLRDVSQTANTRLVYMFSEHSRFGHCLGVAHLSTVLMKILSQRYESEIRRYRTAVSAAALLHDVGHLAPGSHTAFRIWFPGQKDNHEEIAATICKDSQEIHALLSSVSPILADEVVAILSEDSSLPPWTWQIISGGGWNVDRGNWCIVDSIMAGVSYGKYNIPALMESIELTKDKQLALRENRIDAMVHFALSRHAMYRQVYQHRVLLAADMLAAALVRRARDLGVDKLPFADSLMKFVLDCSSPEELGLDHIFGMRESWWKYHLFRWCEAKDEILRDLAIRIQNRNLLKTVRLGESESQDELRATLTKAVEDAGYDPRYYLHDVCPPNMHAGDSKQSLLVSMDDGRVRAMEEAEPLFQTLVTESGRSPHRWFALPAEAKALVGRKR